MDSGATFFHCAGHVTLPPFGQLIDTRRETGRP